MTEEAPPEADRAPGAPHPRETPTLIGQDAAEREFIEACASGRLHHAWLITGPSGVGKATLAWRIARFLLTLPVADNGSPALPSTLTSLDTDWNDPAIRRALALSEPRLFLLRRPWDEKTERLRQEITVDEVRRLRSFFGLSVTDGGYRTVIVDTADEMNVNAANALLKLLEEPPANTVMLLVCHQPSGILPTIRSRCRTLRCRTLEPDEIGAVLAQAGLEGDVNAPGLAALSGGSAGTALRLLTLDGLAIYSELIGVFANRSDRTEALALADSVAGAANAERFELVVELLDVLLARLAHAGLAAQTTDSAIPGETELFSRLCPDARTSRHWAALHQELGTRARQGRSVNLDPATLLLDIVFRIHEAAARPAA